MNLSEGERAPDQGGPVYFGLNFPETSIIFSLLYERRLCTPPRDQVMDEIERRELYPTARHIIPAAMDAIEDLESAMRDYLVAFAGEDAVRELETRVEKTIQKMREGN